MASRACSSSSKAHDQRTVTRDLHIIQSEDQKVLGSGVMLHPNRWLPSSWGDPFLPGNAADVVSSFDGDHFSGE